MRFTLPPDVVSSLPRPPAEGWVRPNQVLIIEWLPDHDQRTGWQLHTWIESRRRGWSIYRKCATGQDVLKAIDHAARDTKSSGLIPVLHLEAHGGESGLEGPVASGGLETLTWDTLTEPLQRLNLATRCNLLLVVAACTGFAGIKALTRGPRAPAVALVGPDGELLPSQVLEGMKEFYRRLQDKGARLHEMAESASHQAGSVIFEPEPFVDMVYDVVADTTIAELRRSDRTIPKELIGELNQRIWDEMFMIDLFPENHERFGLDVRALVAQISAYLRPAG